MKTPATSLTDMASKPSKHVTKAAASVERPALQRLNIDLSADTHAALKSKAAGMKLTMKEVVEKLVDDFLK